MRVQLAEVGSSDRKDHLLIVEDEEMVRRSFKRFFQKFAPVIAVASAAEAYRIIGDKTPLCAAVVDWRLPDEDGVAVIRCIRMHYPVLPVLMVTAHLDRECINQAQVLRAEYVTKPTAARNLDAFARRALRVPTRKRLARAVRRLIQDAGVSEGEARVLEAVADGCSRTSLASELEISENTLKTQVRRLLKKTGYGNIVALREDLLRRAAEAPDVG